jgi:hypothetical protein
VNAVDPLVADYLRRLDQAAAGLPADRRAELVLEIRDHIAAAQAGGATDEAGVRDVLRRLGPPEEIADAARDDVPGGRPAVVLQQPGIALETAAVLLLTVGSVVPVVGWVAGVVLLWTSRRWTGGEKLLGTLVVPLGPGGLLLTAPFLSAGSGRARPAPPRRGGERRGPGERRTTCTVTGPPSWATAVLAAFCVVAPLLVAVLLHRRARRRAAAEPPVPVAPRHAGCVALGGAGGRGGAHPRARGPARPVRRPARGLVLVCCSPRWTRREKVVAGVLCILPVLLAAVPPWPS